MKKILNFYLGALIIFIVQFVADCILKMLNLQFPCAILGIVIFFILLKIGIIKEKWIKDFCDFILKYMILFFIPVFVGMINYQDVVIKNLWQFLLIVVMTTSFVMIITSIFIELGLKNKEGVRND